MARKPKAKTEKVRTPDTGPGGVPIVVMPESFDFLTSVQLWQGSPKTGKTSTAAALRGAAEELGIDGIKPFFLLFEPGSGGVTCEATSEVCDCGKDKNCPECGGLGIKRKILSTLPEMEEWFDWAAKSDRNPIIIDTGDAMYQAVSDAVCVAMGITNPTQADHGIAWVNIFDEMRSKLSILTGAGKSVIIIMHVYMQERRLKGGATIQTATFNVSGKTRPYLAGLANQILHFDVVPEGDEDKHIIITHPTAGIEAGDHWGIMPEELDRGDSPEEGAKAILKCFYEVE